MQSDSPIKKRGRTADRGVRPSWLLGRCFLRRRQVRRLRKSRERRREQLRPSGVCSCSLFPASTHRLVATSLPVVSSLLAFTSHARPMVRRAQMPYQLGSNSYHARPCREDWGWAWWLLCHPSPKVSRAIQKLFLEVSRVSKRREPHMWVAELTSQVQ
jgi:hypothetical protein